MQLLSQKNLHPPHVLCTIPICGSIAQSHPLHRDGEKPLLGIAEFAGQDAPCFVRALSGADMGRGCVGFPG